jgi:hypothetical protein
MLEDANSMSEEDLGAGKCQQDVVMLHKYGNPVTLSMTINMGGEPMRMSVACRG